MARFLFVNPSTNDVKGATAVALTMPPLGLAYLAAALQASGHEARIIDAHLEGFLPQDVVASVSEAPDVVGISSNILTIRPALRYAAALKGAFPAARVILGGPYASIMGRKLLEDRPFIDAVIVGEGERTICEIALGLSQPDPFRDVKGVMFRCAGQVIDNGPRDFVSDIDALPFPAYGLLPDLRRYRSRSRASPVGYIFTSRGCPAACTFCYRTFGARFRARSPEKVLEEIAYLREHYGICQLDILDDNFTFDAARARRILEMIRDRHPGLKINLQIGVRVHSLDESLLKVMKEAGVFKFGFGIESGDQAMLKRIKKGLSLERAVELVRLARSMGFVTHGYFMIGFPGDTPETMQRTIDFAVKLDPHYASFSICTPLPGTEMFDDIVKNGTMLEDVSEGIDEGIFALKSLFRYGDADPDDVVRYCKKAWKNFYLRPGKIVDVLSTVRSWGEAGWLWRVVSDIQRSRGSNQ
ncbi:MAG: radical SAM protein [Candidatus Omnitrophica bacterium]|nr:radical SAM protein [Candidatus Omnitrophota bacterium]